MPCADGASIYTIMRCQLGLAVGLSLSKPDTHVRVDGLVLEDFSIVIARGNINKRQRKLVTQLARVLLLAPLHAVAITRDGSNEGIVSWVLNTVYLYDIGHILYDYSLRTAKTKCSSSTRCRCYPPRP